MSQNKSGLTPAILDFTGQEISVRPHHTLQAQRTSANTSKLARRPYAPHPQARTKLAIQKNKHNQNKQAVWTSLWMPSTLSACDPLIVEYENKTWSWKETTPNRLNQVEQLIRWLNRLNGCQWEPARVNSTRQTAKNIFYNTCKCSTVAEEQWFGVPGSLIVTYPDVSPLSFWLSDQMSLLVNYLCCCYFSRQASSSLPPFLQASYQHVSPPSLSPLSLHLNTVQTPDVC